VKVGLKEIEVGFPSAGATEYDFIRSLVTENRVPDDVMIQVLTQSRADLIKTSFESLAGMPSSHRPRLQRRLAAVAQVVFGMEKSADPRDRRAAPRCCATMPRASRRPTGTSNIRPRPSRPRNSISASNAAKR
jgi:hypothetical protein